MRDDDTILRNLEAKQAAFFLGCEKRGLSLTALAVMLDAPIATLSSYRATRAKPKPALMSLALFIKIAGCEDIPTDLANLLIEDSGHQLAPIDGTRTDWLPLAARTAAFASKVCQFQDTGGHIDHREEAQLREDMLIIISEGHGAVTGAGS
jgi:hypothetical protein